MTDKDEARLKRQIMRSWRRGTKEMDLILGPFADTALSTLSPADRDLYDQLIEENDQDLYQWVSGQMPAPDRFQALILTIRAARGIS